MGARRSDDILKEAIDGDGNDSSPPQRTRGWKGSRRESRLFEYARQSDHASSVSDLRHYWCTSSSGLGGHGPWPLPSISTTEGSLAFLTRLCRRAGQSHQLSEFSPHSSGSSAWR